MECWKFSCRSSALPYVLLFTASARDTDTRNSRTNARIFGRRYGTARWTEDAGTSRLWRRPAANAPPPPQPSSGRTDRWPTFPRPTGPVERPAQTQRTTGWTEHGTDEAGRTAARATGTAQTSHGMLQYILLTNCYLVFPSLSRTYIL